MSPTATVGRKPSGCDPSGSRRGRRRRKYRRAHSEPDGITVGLITTNLVSNAVGLIDGSHYFFSTFLIIILTPI